MSNVNISVNPQEEGNVKLIYILNLVSVILGITSVVAVIMAYIGKSGASPMLVSHYNNQINLFWKALLYGFVAFLLTFILIGLFVFIAILIWWIIRNVQGMQALSRQQPIANPGSWLL